MKACDVVNIYLVSFICNFLKMIYDTFMFRLNRHIFLLSKTNVLCIFFVLRSALQSAAPTVQCAALSTLQSMSP